MVFLQKYCTFYNEIFGVGRKNFGTKTTHLKTFDSVRIFFVSLSLKGIFCTLHFVNGFWNGCLHQLIKNRFFCLTIHQKKELINHIYVKKLQFFVNIFQFFWIILLPWNLWFYEEYAIILEELCHFYWGEEVKLFAHHFHITSIGQLK